MADIFISYKREDRERIAPLARALETRGYTVWWDLELVPSQKFERQIKRELDAACCVIVVWTDKSVADDGMYASEWVQIEANSGDARGVLLPVQLDAGRQHWRHGQSQFAALHGWTGDESASGFVDLLRGVELHAGARERPVDRELAAWQGAEQAEIAEGFRRFLEDFPQSRFADLAKGRIAELDELAAWNGLGPHPTITGLAGFLRRYSAGRYADEAEAKMKALEFASAGQGTPSRSPASFGKGLARRIAVGGGTLTMLTLAAFLSNKFVIPGREKSADVAAASIEAAGAEAGPASIALPAATAVRPAVALGQQNGGPQRLPDRTEEPLDPVERAIRVVEEGGPVARRAFRDCADCPEMVVVASGSFLMGAPASEIGGSDIESPRHRVTIGYLFAVGKYEVTWEEWNACVDDGGCAYHIDDGFGVGRRPVTLVSWYDAKAYTTWLSRKTGQSYRLLSEAEWEYAARAGTTTAYSFGSSISSSKAKYNSLLMGKTSPVGQYPPNAFGLYDMHGNVGEWVEDCYESSYSAGQPSDGRAYTRDFCFGRVFRGGSWGSNQQLLRSAYRGTDLSKTRVNYLGFRLARHLS